jgi:NTP pyrophosphatase (non-canonical NTP hydrolase)
MTITTQALLDLQTEIFEINKANGFWDMGVENRSFAQHISLVHSEVSEAVEADRKDLWDDKLPEYKGIAVELADVAIRILDWTGANKQAYTVDVPQAYFLDYADFSEFAAEIHLLISKWYATKDVAWGFIVLDEIVDYANANDIPFMEIVEKKLQKNRERGYKHGGKNY